jgi:multiple sugar transport system ATP-binding protein
VAEVRVRDLTVDFAGATRALDRLSLAIEDGEFFALLGPSGCGKTTLLRTIAGLIKPSHGLVEIGGVNVTGLSPGERNVAMVFQDYALYPHMTVEENIAYPLKVRHVSKHERAEVARVTGGHLGLSQFLERRPAQLSGGQQQRVALARAIACRPNAFLLDEPLSNLDARLRLEARSFLKRLQRELGTTTIYVTHDQSEALAMADRMAVMESGVVRQVGTPLEVFRHPANLFVAQFTGSTPMNLIQAEVDGGALYIAGHLLRLPDTFAPLLENQGPITVGIRPEYARFCRSFAPVALPGTAVIVEQLGVSALVTVEDGDLALRVVVPADEAPQLGDKGWVVPDLRHLLLYGRNGQLLTSPQHAAISSAGQRLSGV